MSLTGKQRLSTVVAVAWLIFVAFATEPWKYSFPYRGWALFLTFGVAPIAIIIAIFWIRRSFQNDRKGKT